MEITMGLSKKRKFLDLELKTLYHYILTLSILIHLADLSLYQSLADFVLTIIVHLRSLYIGQYQITKYGCLTVGHRFFILFYLLWYLLCFTFF